MWLYLGKSPHEYVHQDFHIKGYSKVTYEGPTKQTRSVLWHRDLQIQKEISYETDLGG